MKRSFLTLAKRAAALADDKKALDITLINVQKLTAETDYVLIASGESTPQVNAIRESITQTLKDEEGIIPLRCDGRNSVSWSIIDYGGLLIHIISPKMREFYAIDKIYAEGKALKV